MKRIKIIATSGGVQAVAGFGQYEERSPCKVEIDFVRDYKAFLARIPELEPGEVIGVSVYPHEMQ